jgi:sugar/nucleoside kinase (ribokinase family)
MPREFDAVVAGHICLDLIPGFLRSAPSLADLFVPGTILNMGPLSAATGGPVANTGIALHRLGHRVALMAKVGDDLLGHAVLTRLREIGAEEGVVVVRGGQTAYTVALAPPGIDRLFLHGIGVNDTFSAPVREWGSGSRRCVSPGEGGGCHDLARHVVA